MKIPEYFFVTSIFAVSIQATNFHSYVDTENVDTVLEEPDAITIPVKINIAVDEKENLQEMFTRKMKKYPEIFIDDQKILMKVKLELLKLQNKAITDKFYDLEENNKKLKEKLEKETHETTSPKPTRVILEAGSEIFIIRLKKCFAFLILFNYFYNFA